MGLRASQHPNDARYETVSLEGGGLKLEPTTEGEAPVRVVQERRVPASASALPPRAAQMVPELRGGLWNKSLVIITQPATGPLLYL